MSNEEGARGMSEEEKTTPPPQQTTDEAAEDAKKQTCYYVAIVQADYSAQMDVFRWLLSDRGYITVAILHDKDVFDKKDVEKKGKNGIITRKNGDGTESQYRVGDVKPAHYHIMLKTPKKCTVSALKNRFCNQVNFMRCADRFYYAAYLLHETFDSQHKAHYEETELIFSRVTTMSSVNYYQECRTETDTRAADAVDRALKFVKIASREAGVTSRELVEFALDNSDAVLLRSIMSHAFFYKSFILGDGGGEK